MPSLHLENSIVDDRYEVRRRLNHGSYAEIYEAFDLERSRRPVIIKALNTSLQGTPEEDLERTLIENFQNEAIALDTVSHPNVIRRLGHGTAADLAGTPFHYIVLEYMSGGDLMAVCRRGPLSLTQTLYYARQICEALEEAHTRGIIHRDIKPNNLLISADERIIKITDFGVAKLSIANVNADVTRVGTDAYAPPEHSPNADTGGLRERLTPSADVYSLAKTIYTALTGRAPRQFVRLPIGELPPHLASQAWGPALLAILRRATATSPADRYPTVGEFWADLALLLEQARDDEDERTHVRPREGLRHVAPMPPAAPMPQFKPQHNTGGRVVEAASPPRIVVTLEEPRAVPAPAGRASQPADPVDEEPYSFREDLRDLVGRGAGLRIGVLVVVLGLFGGVAGVYYGVQQFVVARVQRQATVTAMTLTLRDGPSQQSNAIGLLPSETRVRILRQEADGPWCEVKVTRWGGPVDSEQPDQGWVNSKFLDVDAP